MADDRIDIVVNDKIDPSIPLKLREIQTSADKGSVSVARLKAELASMNGSAVKTLATETQTATNAINKQLTAQNALSTAVTRNNTANVAAASTATKNVAAIDAEAAAQARLAAVIDKTIARQKVAAGTTFASGGNPFQAEANLASSAAAVAASTRTVQAAVTEAEVATVGSFGRMKNAALTMYDGLRDAGYAFGQRFSGFLGPGGATTVEKEAVSIGKLGKSASVNSTAIRELFVLAREASRGNFSRMAGSVSILAGALGLLYSVLIPVTIAIGVFVGGMKLFEESIRSEADPQLKNYANTLGLTHKEMRKLGDETVGAKGKLEEFNSVSLTFGDVWKGLGRTLNQDLGMNKIGESMKSALFDAAYASVKAMGEAAASIYAAFYATFFTIKTLWKHMPGVFDAIGTEIANGISQIFEDMINDIIRELNKIDVKLRALFGMSKSIPIAYIHIQKQVPGTDDGKDAQKVLENTYNEAFASATKAEHKFLDDWKKNSIQAGKDRLKEMADAIKNNRNPKKEADPKTKDDYLNDTNKKLDDELSRMHLLKDAREEQSRLDQIEEEFAKRRQPLTQAEIDGFAKKIHAIQEFKYQQAEMDRIYDQFNVAQKVFNAGVAAADDLLQRHTITTKEHTLAVAQATAALDASKDLTGATAPLDEYNVKLAQIAVSLDNFATSNGKFGISQAQANQETVKAGIAFQEATNPLYALTQGLITSEAASTKYGLAVQQQSYYEQIRQAYLKQGIVLDAEYTAGQNTAIDAIMRRNAALQQQLTIQAGVGAIVNPILQDQQMLQNKQAYYDELNRMADKYNLDEAHRAQARYALDLKFNQSRLEAASSFFGTLAQLSTSGNKKLALIGKAAAIAQATIDGVLAVQKALASAPPPWNVIEAAAIGALTAYNIAKIISTPVGSYANGGSFMVDGKAGVDQNNINMNVSRGERVTIETPAQQRANDRRSGTHVSVHPKIINVLDKRELLSVLDSAEGEDLILNVISRNPNAVAGMIGA